jgi:diphthamide biosynthesis enzyme Dph1/Dph2-like protein
MISNPTLKACVYAHARNQPALHLLLVLMQHSGLQAYRYDPYSKEFTIEGYDTAKMHETRKKAIAQASTSKVCNVV